MERTWNTVSDEADEYQLYYRSMFFDTIERAKEYIENVEPKYHYLPETK